ncbi:MAG: hypothetical protein ACE5OO_08805 [Candidatus Bathyarchaeia archaeon]
MVENPKKLLVELLQGNIHVYEDDGLTEVPGVVSAAWYDAAIFEDHGWQVTVGPTVDADTQVMDLGAHHKAYDETVQVTVWVLEKRGVNYTPERIRGDLIHAVDERLLAVVNSPGGGISHLNVSGWVDRDEPENGILRSDLTVVVEYEKERA